VDCFVAVAPLRKRFAFVAGNDVEAHIRTPRDAIAPELSIYPSPKEGVGNAGRPLHPQPRVGKIETTRA